MIINVEVHLKEDESSEKLIKRFFKKCKKQEIVREYLDKTVAFKTNSRKRKEKRLKNRYMKSKES
jgi:ribosomal protein S21